MKESAPRLVREANRLLLGDRPAEALNEYQKAESIKPDAREIAFGEGLANYKLGEYDKARDAFNRATGGAGDNLADDALYSLGTCDHAEALAAQDPKSALSKLENAMRDYQGVLSHRPDHLAARDANLKAASYWRQLKQQLQQQQEQKDSDKNKNQKDNEQQQQEQQQQEQQEQKQDQKLDEQTKQQQQQQDEEKRDQNPQKEQQQQQSADKDEQKLDEQAEQQKAEQRDVSREQAERKLREMMQALRDRKKLRRDEVKSPPYRPTEKDW